MREGRVLVDVSQHRDELLRIKHGETSWEELDRRRQGLQEEFAAAFKGTPLPDEPNAAAVNDFLLRARRSMVDA